jgi:hypothetical protein
VQTSLSGDSHFKHYAKKTGRNPVGTFHFLKNKPGIFSKNSHAVLTTFRIVVREPCRSFFNFPSCRPTAAFAGCREEAKAFFVVLFLKFFIEN